MGYTTSVQNIFIILGLFSLSIVFSEVAFHMGYPNYVSRSISHIAASLVSLLLPALLPLNTVVIIGLGFAVLLFIAKEFGMLKGMYKHNSEGVGPFLFPIGLTIAAVTFWEFQPAVFQVACLVLGFSDALAGMIGKTFGKIKFQFSVDKTVEGSLVFFITTLLIFCIMIPLYKLNVDISRIARIVAGSLILTITESSFGNGWDNLVLPFVSGFVAVWVFV
jgi:dolichol kinase